MRSSADALHYSSDLISSVLVLIGLAATAPAFPTPTRSPRSASPVSSPSPASSRPGDDRRAGRPRARGADRGDPRPGHPRPRASPASRRSGCVRAAPRSWATSSSGCRAPCRSNGSPRSRPSCRRASPGAGRRLDVTITANPLALDDETILERVLRHRGAPGPAGAPCHHPGYRRPQERRARPRGRRRDAARRRPSARFASSKTPSPRKSARASRSRPTSSRPSRKRAGSRPSPISPAASRRSLAVRRSGARAACATSITCACARPPAAFTVLFHCRVDPATPVEAVHDAVDALERSVREAFPEARRVVGHAEPAGG